MIAEAATALLRGEVPSREASLFLGSALQEWLQTGGDPSKDFLRGVKPKSKHTASYIWKQMQVHREERQAVDDASQCQPTDTLAEQAEMRIEEHQRGILSAQVTRALVGTRGDVGHAHAWLRGKRAAYDDASRVVRSMVGAKGESDADNLRRVLGRDLKSLYRPQSITWSNSRTEARFV